MEQNVQLVCNIPPRMSNVEHGHYNLIPFVCNQIEFEFLRFLVSD